MGTVREDLTVNEGEEIWLVFESRERDPALHCRRQQADSRYSVWGLGRCSRHRFRCMGTTHKTLKLKLKQ